MRETTPQTPDLEIERTRLTKSIEAADARALFIESPPGYGGSTIARQWIDQQESAQWLACQCATFSLSSALAALGRLTRMDEALLSAKRPLPELAEVLAINLRGSTKGQPAALVFDDYGTHVEHEAIDELLDWLLAYDAPLRILAVGTRRPPWINAARTLSGEAFSIESRELKLDHNELAALASKLGYHSDPARLSGRTIGIARIICAFPDHAIDEHTCDDRFLTLAQAVISTSGATVRRPSAQATETASPLLDWDVSGVPLARLDALRRAGLLNYDADGNQVGIRAPHNVVRGAPPSNRTSVPGSSGATKADRLLASSREALDDNRLAEAEAAALDAARAAEHDHGRAHRAWLMAATAARLRSNDADAFAHAQQSRRHAARPEEHRAALVALVAASCELNPTDAGGLLAELRDIPPLTNEDRLRDGVLAAMIDLRLGSVSQHPEHLEALTHLARSAEVLPATSLLSGAAYLNALTCHFDRALALSSEAIDRAEAAKMPMPRVFLHHIRCIAHLGRRDVNAAAREALLTTTLAAQTDDASLQAIATATKALMRLSTRRPSGSNPPLPRICNDTTVPRHFRGEIMALHALELATAGEHLNAADMARAALACSPDVETQTYARAAIAVATTTSNAPSDTGDSAASELVRDASRRNCLWPVLLALRLAPDMIETLSVDDSAILSAERILMRSSDRSLLSRLSRVDYGAMMTDRFVNLTKREVEVVELISSGLTNQQISARLCIAESTTKVHVSSILDKTGCANRLEAALAWRERHAAGLIVDPIK